VNRNQDLSGLRLIAHPLRLRILSLLTGNSLSAAEVARQLDETQANISYHLRRLADGGLLRLVDEQKVRGGIAKRYTHDSASAEEFATSSSGEMRQLLTLLAQEMVRRGDSYREGSTHAFTDAQVLVTIDARDRLEEVARDLGRQIHDAAASEETAPRVPISVTVALFEMIRT